MVDRWNWYRALTVLNCNTGPFQQLQRLGIGMNRARTECCTSVETKSWLQVPRHMRSGRNCAYTNIFAHIYHNQVTLLARISLLLSLSLSLSLFIRPDNPSLLAGLLDSILCLFRATKGSFFFVSQHLYVHMKRSIREPQQWVCPACLVRL